MHPDFHQMRIDERQREIQDQAQSANLLRQASEPVEAAPEAVILRLCSVHDDDALEQIAALEGVQVAPGRHVVAEVDGDVVASLPLGGGARLADPFRPTAHLIPLLELRAKQLAPGSVGRRRLAIPGAQRIWSRA